MKFNKMLIWSMPVGLILFHCLFWGEKMGLNSLVFTLFIIAALFINNKKNGYSGPAITTALGTILIAIMVVINNSMLSKLMLFLSAFTMAGYMNRKDLQFLGFAFFTTLRNMLSVPFKTIEFISKFFLRKKDVQKANRMLQLGVIPIIMFIVFYCLYYTANPKFAGMSDHYWSFISGLFSSFSSTISFVWVIFMILGLLMIGALIWKPSASLFLNLQAKTSDELIRTRKKNSHAVRPTITPISLKQEYQTATVLIISLNILLLLVNGIDIRYVWFNFSPLSPSELSNFVHEGTYALIFSILIAIGLLLYFFRGNLNFLQDTKILKLLSMAWICQNALLVLSVGARNFHYIRYYGLAYKRIGVIVFLILTLIGLLLLWIKIRDRKTLYFLLYRNAWAIYSIMVMLTFINWDGVITRYNLIANTKDNIDVFFLINGISDKNIYLLKEAQTILEENASQSYKKYVGDNLRHKEIRFYKEQVNYSFLSWNFPDSRNKKYLNSHTTKK